MLSAAVKGNQSFNLMDGSRRQSGNAFCVSSSNVEEEYSVSAAAALSAARKFHLHCVERRVCLKPPLMLGLHKNYLYRLHCLADWLRVGRSGDWIPVGARFFTHFQTGSGAHPAFCTMGTGVFPGVKWPGRGADHPLPPSAEVENE
jgi:hypothetical protein